MTDEIPDKIILKQTPLGTVIRPDWSNDWTRLVMLQERKEKRAICGAETQAGRPCSLSPQSKYGYYCSIHKNTGLAKPYVAGTGEVILKNQQHALPIVMAKHDLKEMFFRCNTCISRNTCHHFIPDETCSLEEQVFDDFFNRAVEEYGLEYIDRYMIYSIAMSMIRQMRANRVLARITVASAEEGRISWMAVRESKEFRDGMKELGLTRRERIEQARDEAGLSKLNVQTTLAEIMSQIKKEVPEQLEVELTQKFKVRKKEVEKRALDLIEEKDYIQIDDGVYSTIDDDNEDIQEEENGKERKKEKRKTVS